MKAFDGAFPQERDVQSKEPINEVLFLSYNYKIQGIGTSLYQSSNTNMNNNMKFGIHVPYFTSIDISPLLSILNIIDFFTMGLNA